MRVSSTLILALPFLALACAGTSTGNPMNSEVTGGTGGTATGGTGGSVSQHGFELIKSDAAPETSPQLPPADATSFADNNRELAFDLYRELADDTKNLFFSPYSISVALAMTYAGAEADTEREIAETMHFGLPEPSLHVAFNATTRALEERSEELAPDSEGDGFELRIINQAFGQTGYPFLESYLDVLAVNYGSGLFGVNFADSENVRQLINGWVADQTEQRIEDLLPPGALTSDSRLVLTNAIYFKASWLSEFAPEDTEDEEFETPSGPVTVPMMHQSLRAQYGEGNNYQALALPYVSPAVQMVFILPEAGAFTEITSSLDDALFQQVLSSMSQHDTTVALPRFEFESENPLKQRLGSLGMPLAFTADADFTGLAGGIEPLWIDEVYHKAFVALDETGTEAAAATAVVITTESAVPVAEISFDRPFIFGIYDEPTGQLLFLGQVVDPS